MSQGQVKVDFIHKNNPNQPKFGLSSRSNEEEKKSENFD